MKKLQELEPGNIYWLHGYTAPKVFNGLYFECLVTDQKIPSHTRVKKRSNIHIKDWQHYIYKRERFGLKNNKLNGTI